MGTNVKESDIKALIRYIKEEKAYTIVMGKIIPFYFTKYKSTDVVRVIKKIAHDNDCDDLSEFFNRIYFFKDWKDLNHPSSNDERYSKLSDKWRMKVYEKTKR